MARTSLSRLYVSARGMGLPVYITGTGGNVIALALTIDGSHLLLALDDGTMTGNTWTISTDGETRETHGERESDAYPVTSDADQTILDVIGWWRAASVAPRHGERVRHARTGEYGTAVGDLYASADGEPMVGVVWSDSPDYVEPTYLRTIVP